MKKNKIIRNCNNGNKINDNECKYWIYAKDFYDTIIYNDNTRKSENNITNIGSKVMCLTTGEKFESTIEAIEKYNLNKDNLMKCCRGTKKTCGRLSDGTKLKWSYI